MTRRLTFVAVATVVASMSVVVAQRGPVVIGPPAPVPAKKQYDFFFFVCLTVSYC